MFFLHTALLQYQTYYDIEENWPISFGRVEWCVGDNTDATIKSTSKLGSPGVPSRQETRKPLHFK